MTLTDLDLTTRIRRAVRHYRFDRPIDDLGPVANVRRRPRWLALGGATVLAAAALTVAVLSILPIGGWRIGADPPASAISACRSELQLRTPHVIPSRWLREGEMERHVRERLAAMPVVAHEQRTGAVLLLLTDGRFATTCVVTALDSMLGPYVAAIRTVAVDELPPGAVRYGWGHTGEMGPVVAGGAAADSVTTVEVIRTDGARIDAILAGGVWAAWWREPLGSVAVVGLDEEGNVVAEDGAGIVVPPPASHPPQQVAARECLDGVGDIPEPWRLPGEDYDEAVERLRNLPLLMVAEDRWNRTLLLGDETFWVMCSSSVVEGGTGGSSGPRESFEGAIQYKAASQSGSLAPPHRVVAGFAAPEVARVTALLGDGSEAEGQVIGGYWLISWNVDADVELVRAFDQEGRLLDEVPSPPR